MKINILGTEYNYRYETRAELDMPNTLDGECSYQDKKIRIVKDTYETHEPELRKPKNQQDYLNLVKRHEIIHAFIYEAGISHKYNDELLVDWLAVMLPKMLDACKVVDAI